MSRIERQSIVYIRLAGLDALTASRGAEAAKGLLGASQGVVRSHVQDNDGSIVDTIGAEQLVLLPTPDLALSLACQVLRRLAKGSLVPHIGIHHGVVYRNDSGIYGDTVNTGARITGEATPGQALISRDAVLALHEESRQLVRQYDRVELKGKQDAVRLYQVLWQPEDLDATNIGADMIDTGYLKQLSAERLELLVAGERHQVVPGMTPVTIGRGIDCDITVAAAAASRTHAVIDHRRGKFVLVDQSTNGTHVRRTDGTTGVIRREEAVLTGNGCLALGCPVADAGQWKIVFTCS